jgi:hypothetical protein
MVDEEKTIVIFRKGANGEVFALFPEMPNDHFGYLCTCYRNIEGHIEADYLRCIGESKPAKPEEYEQLAKLLVCIGYRLTIRNRASSKMHGMRVVRARQAQRANTK